LNRIASYGLKYGDLKGNRFTIAIRLRLSGKLLKNKERKRRREEFLKLFLFLFRF